jgi:predicted Rossmann-fold nucleotide-binding protein
MTDNTAQKASASYRLPALDQDFLLGDSMRGVRLQLEYEKAEERLRAWVVRSTIVVFGSARALAPDPSAQILQSGEPTSLSGWYEGARRFGRLASERCGPSSRAMGCAIMSSQLTRLSDTCENRSITSGTNPAICKEPL